MTQSPPSRAFQGSCLFLLALLLGSRLLFGELLWSPDWPLAGAEPPHGLPGILERFTDLLWSQHSPLASILFSAERKLFGFNAFGYHIVSLLLHAGNTLLLWHIGRRMQLRAAWWGAAFFAAHPMAMETISLVDHQNVLLGLLFSQLAILPMLAEKIRPAGYAMSILSTALALLAKVNAAALPLILLLCRWWKSGKIDRPTLNPILPHILVGFFIVLQINSTILNQSQGEPRQDSFVVKASQEAVHSGETIFYYLRNAALPLNLSCYHPENLVQDNSNAFSYRAVGRIAVLVAIFTIIGLGFAGHKHTWGRALLLLTFSYLLLLFPLLRIMPAGMPRGMAYANHQQYLLLPIVCFAVAAIASNSLKKGSWDMPKTVFSLLALAFYVASGTLNMGQYQTTETLWQRAITFQEKHTKDERLRDFEPYQKLADFYRNDGTADNRENAIDLYDQVLEYNPQDARALEGLANIRFRKGNYPEAVRLLEIAHEQRPEDLAILGLLAKSQYFANQLPQARRNLETLHAAEPGNKVTVSLLADANYLLKRYDEAAGYYEMRLLDNPSNELFINNTAECYLFSGQPEKAVQLYSRIQGYLEAKPERLTGLAGAHLQLGDIAEARATYEKALNADPGNLLVLNNYAWALATSKDDGFRDGKRALIIAQQAADKVNYQSPYILSTLAASCAETEKWIDAARYADDAIKLSIRTGERELAERTRQRLVAYREKRNIYE